MRVPVIADIRNMKDYAYGFKYIVVRRSEIDGSLWFFGAWNDIKDADEAVERLSNGILLENAENGAKNAKVDSGCNPGAD